MKLALVGGVHPGRGQPTLDPGGPQRDAHLRPEGGAPVPVHEGRTRGAAFEDGRRLRARLKRRGQLDGVRVPSARRGAVESPRGGDAGVGHRGAGAAGVRWTTTSTEEDERESGVLRAVAAPGGAAADPEPGRVPRRPAARPVDGAVRRCRQRAVGRAEGTGAARDVGARGEARGGPARRRGCAGRRGWTRRSSTARRPRSSRRPRSGTRSSGWRPGTPGPTSCRWTARRAC